MRIKNLCYSTNTYIQYNIQRGETGQNKHVISTSQIGPITTK